MVCGSLLELNENKCFLIELFTSAFQLLLILVALGCFDSYKIDHIVGLGRAAVFCLEPPSAAGLAERIRLFSLTDRPRCDPLRAKKRMIAFQSAMLI
jgi:hypothetical protein